MKTIIIALAAISSACGSLSDRVQYQHDTTEPRLEAEIPAVSGDTWMKEFVLEFYADAQAKDHRVENDVVSVSFIEKLPESMSKTDKGVIGYCSINNNSDGSERDRTVSILKSAWVNFTWQTKRVLIYHELGHCALNLDHSPEGSGNIMDPYVLYDSESLPHWMELVDTEFASSNL